MNNLFQAVMIALMLLLGVGAAQSFAIGKLRIRNHWVALRDKF